MWTDWAFACVIENKYDQLSKGDISLPHVHSMFVLTKWVWLEKRDFFQANGNWIKEFAHTVSCLICCGWFVRASEIWREKKSLFFSRGKKKGHTKWLLPFSCNFMKNVKQYSEVLFTHCRRENSLPNVKITDDSISIFCF